MTKDHDFVPGADVVIVSDTLHGKRKNLTARTVEKVYKTGNFTLNGSSDQYRAASKDTAFRAGDNWVRSRVLLKSAHEEEIKALLSVSRSIAAIGAAIEALRRAREFGVLDDETLNLVRAVSARLADNEKT